MSSSEELSRQVEEEFYKRVSQFDGRRFEFIVEPDTTGMARSIVENNGTLRSSIYNRIRTRDRFGKPIKPHGDGLDGIIPGSFFMTELYRRRGFDKLYLASKVQVVEPHKFRWVLQTNDHPSYTSMTGFDWKPVELIVPEKPKLVETDSTDQTPSAPEEKKAKKEKAKKSEPVPDSKPDSKPLYLTREQCSKMIRAKLRGKNKWETVNYSGLLVIGGRLNSSVFTQRPYERVCFERFSGIPEGVVIGVEIGVNPERRGKYLAAIVETTKTGTYVRLETNDYDRVVRNSLDVWRRV